MSRKWVFDRETKSGYDASSKARADVTRFLCDDSFQPWVVSFRQSDKRWLKAALNIIPSLRFFVNLLFKLRGDLVIVQYPITFHRLILHQRLLCFVARRRAIRLVALIHDLESLRQDVSSEPYDPKLLGAFDGILSHNAAMTRWLKDHGVDVPIVDIELFDYFVESAGPPSLVMPIDESPTLVFAGNLSRTKSAFLYKLTDELRDLRLNLYGKGYNPNHLSQNLRYKGYFDPNEFHNLEGNYGLVWDGLSTEGCQGKLGNYLRYNSPHKLSLYIAANLPVIVWSESAIAPFVVKNGIGITVEKLSQIPDKLKCISDFEYQIMIKRTVLLANKLKRGEYLKVALNSLSAQLENCRSRFNA